MRAKQINEFKRGGNPEQKIGLGNHRPYKLGDKLRCIQDIWQYNRKFHIEPGNYQNSARPDYFTSHIYTIKVLPRPGYNSYRFDSHDWDPDLSKEDLDKHFTRIE